MAPKPRKAAPLFRQRQGVTEPAPPEEELFAHRSKSGHPLPNSMGPRAPGTPARRQPAPAQGVKQPVREKVDHRLPVKQSRSMHDLEVTDRKEDPLSGTNFEEEGHRFRRRLDDGHLPGYDQGRRAPARGREFLEEDAVPSQESSVLVDDSDDDVREVKVKKEDSQSLDPAGSRRVPNQPDGSRRYEPGIRPFLSVVESGHRRSNAPADGDLSTRAASHQVEPEHYRGRSMNPHGDAMSKQQVYRDTAPPSKIRDQYQPHFGSHTQIGRQGDARRGAQPDESLADDEAAPAYEAPEPPQARSYSQIHGPASQPAFEPLARGRGEPTEAQEYSRSQPQPMQRRPFQPSHMSRANSASHKESGRLHQVRPVPPERPASAEPRSLMMSMQRLMEERASHAQASQDWQKRYWRAEQEKADLSTKFLVEEDLKSKSEECQKLRDQLHDAALNKQKLVALLQRRSIEADFLLEIKEQHIERLKASNADYISQVVTLKATVKKVDLDCPEAAKAIAAGREAIEAVKSIKTVYDLTESELREVKDKLEEAKVQIDEAEKSKKEQDDAVWESLGHVMDVKDRELLRLSKSNPIVELVRVVKDRHDSLADVQASRDSLQGKLKTVSAQEKALHTTISSLAARFGLDLPGFKQEQLSTFVQEVEKTLEKRDEERMTAAKQMAMLVESQNDLQDKLKNAAGSTLAEAQKEHYERSIADLQIQLDAHKTRASSVPTLQHEIDRLISEVEEYKGKADVSKQEATRAKTKAIEERGVNQELQRQKAEAEVKHAAEIKGSKAEIDRLEKEMQAVVEENTGLKQGAKPNGVGVGASTVLAEEKRKLEATIAALKTQLLEKDKPDSGIVERYKQQQSTEDDQAIIKSLDNAIEASIEAKYEQKIRESREENIHLKKRNQKLDSRVAGLEKEIRQLKENAETEKPTSSNGSKKESSNAKSNGPFVPASSIMKHNQGRKRGADDAGKVAQNAADRQKKPRFSFPSNDEPEVEAQLDKMGSSPLSPVADELLADNANANAEVSQPAPPSTQYPRGARAAQNDPDSDDDDAAFEKLLAEMAMPKSSKAARMNDESDEDDYLPPTQTQSRMKTHASQNKKQASAAKAKGASSKVQTGKKGKVGPQK